MLRQSGLSYSEIAATIIAMARNLRLHVVADGVETEQQAVFLQQEGCDLAQGLFYAPPMPPSEFPDYYRSRMAVASQIKA